MVSRGLPQSNSSTAHSSPTASNQTVNSTQASTAPAVSTSPLGQGGGGPSGRLFVLSQSATNNEIDAINIVTKQKQVIFSDKGSDKKIKLVSPVTGNGDSVVMLLGNDLDPAGQLIAVSGDGSGKKTTLSSNFVSTDAPIVSPDHTKLALVSFSNADPHYGFTLVYMNIDGKNRKDLATDASGISQLAFSPDGKQIAFVKGASANASEIDVVTIESGKVDTLYAAKDKIIADFDWSPVGPLVMTAVGADKKASKLSEVYLVDPKTKVVAQITKAGKSARTPKVAPDATGLAYIQSDDINKPGQITVTFPDGSNGISLGTANQILGWVRE